MLKSSKWAPWQPPEDYLQSLEERERSSQVAGRLPTYIQRGHNLTPFMADCLPCLNYFWRPLVSHGPCAGQSYHSMRRYEAGRAFCTMRLILGHA